MISLFLQTHTHPSKISTTHRLELVAVEEGKRRLYTHIHVYTVYILNTHRHMYVRIHKNMFMLPVCFCIPQV